MTVPASVSPTVVFATPTLAHQMSSHYHRSWTETLYLLWANGISTGTVVRGGDCFVDKARNKLVTDFLRTFPETQNFFFLDDDIGWPAEAVLELLQRPDPIIAGVYPKKGESRDFPCTLAVNADTGELIESEGMFLAVLAPTGFLRIKRNVLETLASQANMFEDITPKDGEYESYAYIFENGRGVDGHYWGEDYTFCRKASAAGFNIWIKPDITFQHQGIKTWEDRLSNHIHIFRQRAKAAIAGTDAETGEKFEVKKVQADDIRAQWAEKQLDWSGLESDPRTRGKFVDMDKDFWPIYDLCRPYTMTSIERMYDLYKAVEYVVKAGIPGAIVESGVWQGGSMMLVAHTLKRLGDEGRLLQLFDTFAGLPVPDPVIDIDSLGKGAEEQWKPGWAEAKLSVVKANMESTGHELVEYHEGFVQDTLPVHAAEQYAIVRLDTDWYASAVVELEVLWPRIAPGGLLIIDDYGHWLGVRKAVDEYFADKPVRMTRVDYSCRVIQKGIEPDPIAFREAAE